MTSLVSFRVTVPRGSLRCEERELRRPDDAIIIGSEPDADLRITAPGVRPRHVRLTMARDDHARLEVQALDSAATVTVNGSPITDRVSAGNGSILCVGKAHILLGLISHDRAEADSQEAATREPPEPNDQPLRADLEPKEHNDSPGAHQIEHDPPPDVQEPASSLAEDRTSPTRQGPGRYVDATERQAPDAFAEFIPSGDASSSGTDPREPTHRTAPSPTVDNITWDDLGYYPGERIGQGGCATVYKALNKITGDPHALKFMSGVSEQGKKRLREEAESACRAKHEAIVRVHRYVDVSKRDACIVMDYISGPNGKDLIESGLYKRARVFERNAPATVSLESITQSIECALPTELKALPRARNQYLQLVAWWFTKIAEGLAEAHSNGVIHYDIKPANLLLDKSGVLKLTDFGMASQGSLHGGPHARRGGTPRYLPPERIAEWAVLAEPRSDPRSDIWSLGVTLYEFIVKSPAYRSNDDREILSSICVHDASIPDNKWAMIPKQLIEVCNKAMKRNPDDRFRTAGDFATALRECVTAGARTGRFGL